MKKLLILLTGVLIVYLAEAQHTKPDTIIAYYCSEPIKLDGKLNEQCWQKAMKVSNFRQREMHEGQPPTEKTQVAVLYSKNTLYIGVWCYDSQPDKIIAQKMERDFVWNTDDNFKVIISPYNDSRNAYEFIINPNGARADIWLSAGSAPNLSWNGVWDVATTVTDSGWFAEIMIPFSTLKFQNAASQVWQINFERYISRKMEQLLWQGWKRIYKLEILSQAGHLAGLNNLKPGTRWEIKPYILAGAEKYSGQKATPKFNAGLDINYDISPTMRLNLTYNTDFAQVEDDKQIINLTRFSIFYPEKRQFFLEAKQNFEMSLGWMNEVFYSRRIGIGPDGQQVPILGGARLFGKTGRTNLGLMSIQTKALGDSVPTTNYSVFRVKQDIWEQSSVGMIVTSKLEPGRQNIVYAADFNYTTDKFLGDKNLTIRTAIAQSYTSDSVNRQNLATNISTVYDNDIVNFILAFTQVQPNYNPEMGFIRRHDFYKIYSTLKLKPRPRWLPWVRNLYIDPYETVIYYNWETLELETFLYSVKPFGFITRKGDKFEIKTVYAFDRPTYDFYIFDRLIEAGEYSNLRANVSFSSYSGRKLSTVQNISYGGFYNGTDFNYQTILNLSLNKHFSIQTDLNFHDIRLPGDHFQTYEVGTRAIYAFTPKLNTSMFAQWNNELQEILINYRINWIPKIGSDFYLVVNQIISTEGGRLSVEYTTVLAKLIWRFAM